MKTSSFFCLFAIVASFLAGCKSAPKARKAAELDPITFYKVPLICPAAPQIGCGSAAKPYLIQLEQQPTVAEAWLNRAGTLAAIVWKPNVSASERSRTIQKVAKERAPLIRRLSGEPAEKARKQFASRSGWYRGAEVDQLSKEEAQIISARLIRRTRAKASLSNETVAALQPAMTRVIEYAFIGESVPQTQDETRAVLERTARPMLDDRQYIAFQHALDQGYKPQSGER